MDTRRLQEFFDFAYLRQLVYYRKEVQKLPAPWTDNKVLQQYKIINVYRELDRCTKYLTSMASKAKDPFTKFSLICLFKFLNTDQIFHRFGVENKISSISSFGDLESFINSMISTYRSKQYKDPKVPVFNTAYLVTAGKGDKFINILQGILRIKENLEKKYPDLASVSYSELGKKLKDLLNNAESAEASYHLVGSIVPNAGDFISYEIWSQCVYSKVITKFTTNDYCNIGPGAYPSIKYICGNLVDKDPMAALKEIQAKSYETLKGAPKRLGGKDSISTFPSWDKIKLSNPLDVGVGNNLSLLTIENIGCEFRKFQFYNGKKGFSAKTKYYKDTSNVSESFNLVFDLLTKAYGY